jgi:hypothetical protein
MIDRARGQTSARREASVPRANDDRGDLFDGVRPATAVAFVQTTSTVTFTGFVMTSYTAERFCD